MLDINKLPIDIRYRIGMGYDSGLRIKSENDRYAVECYRKLFQQKLNFLKQQKMIEKSNKIFQLFKSARNKIGYKTNENINFLLGQTPSAHFFCNLSLKDLGITKREIIAACVVRSRD